MAPSATGTEVSSKPICRGVGQTVQIERQAVGDVDHGGSTRLPGHLPLDQAGPGAPMGTRSALCPNSRPFLEPAQAGRAEPPRGPVTHTTSPGRGAHERGHRRHARRSSTPVTVTETTRAPAARGRPHHHRAAPGRCTPARPPTRASRSVRGGMAADHRAKWSCPHGPVVAHRRREGLPPEVAHRHGPEVGVRTRPPQRHRRAHQPARRWG